ncbi:MAG: SGNH/GDSL hydrolase family protein [Pontiellaceae bacterium]|nr:SGNH/GDSL hydrolase family protein [Pontiellaceae bacterium]
MSVPFRENDLILFTGDSITDCFRDRADPESLGMGYVAMICGQLALRYPELNLRFRNTGIKAERTADLLKRWQHDCIDLRPNWVSLLVGINNVYYRYDRNDPTSLDQFEREYRELLRRTVDETGVNLILCSPFLLPINDFVAGMHEDLEPKVEVMKSLVEEFDALWVDFSSTFDSAGQKTGPHYWSADGVHPSIGGHALMAETWLRSVEC